MSTHLNSDGLMVRFGRDQGSRGNKTSVVRTAGNVNELTFEVDLEGAARTLFPADRDNDGTLDGFVEGLDTSIPSGAKILSCDVVVLETLAGGTSYSVGTWALDGTVIDADGLRTDAGADGALVGTQVGAVSYVTAKTIGTYTAGKVKIIVRFVPAV